MINDKGVPNPVDHVVLTFILWVVVYVPTKIIYLVLNLFYGQPIQRRD